MVFLNLEILFFLRKLYILFFKKKIQLSIEIYKQ